MALTIGIVLVLELGAARLVSAANTLAEVEDIVRIPILLGLQQSRIRFEAPVAVAKVSAVVAGWSVEVLRRLVPLA